MSHYHGPQDGFPNVEVFEEANHAADDQSVDSNSHSHSPSPRREQLLATRKIDGKVSALVLHVLRFSAHHHQLINQLRAQGQATTITPEIRRYLQDVVAFLRMERGVDGGVTPYATTLFLALSKWACSPTDFKTRSLTDSADISPPSMA
jgi:hypothetical protein